MKKISQQALIFLLFMFSGTAIMGQTGLYSPASARWELTDPATGGTGFTVATEGQVNGTEETFSNTEAPNYTGPGNSQRVRIIGNTWPAGLTWQIDTLWVQFAVSPRESNRLYVDSLSMKICAMSSSTMEANIYYSKDPTFATSTKVRFVDASSNNYLTTTALELLALDDVNVTVEPGETFYVRIYFWNEDASVKTGKYICLQDVYISGRTESLRTPASVTWYADGVEDPVIAGGLLANTPFYSDSMVFYTSSTSLPLIETGTNVTAGAVHTVSKSWNAESDTVYYLYFGGEVRPKTGGTFHIDSVTMNIGGWFSDKLKAAVYYSLHADFSDATLLKADAQLPGNAMNHWSVAMDTSVFTGEVFYLRIYPYSTAAAGWAKLVAINDLKIYGSTIGVTADPPTVHTAPLSYLSTTFVTSGGNIPDDGGALVTSRGVVWDTAAGPTVEDNLTSDGTGSGSFISHVTGLIPGESYYLRAYAINKADTAYGEELSFTALDSVLIPSVVTDNVTGVMVKTAESGGEVTSWGGDTVTARGICWDTVSAPTIGGAHTVNGDGLGIFKSTMYPLTQGTKYFARAYATNAAGTGYGNEVTFTTQVPAPDMIKTVAKDGSGDYTTVQAAFDAVPELYTGSWTIFIKSGIYKEKLLLAKNKVNVVLKADHPDSVILTYDDYAGKSNGTGGTLGTSGSYSVGIDASDFTAYRITFRNTIVNDGTFANQQAVALRTNGDRQAYYHCRLLGYQDTYYTYGLGRVYMKDCYIEGSVDFIFGQATVVFDSCELNVNRSGGVYTAASTNVNSKFGYVFRDCKLMTAAKGFDGSPVSNVYLGRPWQGNPKVVYMNCYEPSTLASAGWTSMNAGLNPLFAEYKCTGPGYKPDLRSTDVNYKGIQLTDEEAAAYTPENIFAMTTNPSFGINWMTDTVGSKFSQTIDFGPFPAPVPDEWWITPHALTATASSRLTVSYTSSNTDVATIEGNTLVFRNPGTADITASQEGNFMYLAAEDVTRTLEVPVPSAIGDNSEEGFSIYPNPAQDRIWITCEAGIPVDLFIINTTGQQVIGRTLVSGNESIDISSLSEGIYVIRLGDKNYKLVVE